MRWFYYSRDTECHGLVPQALHGIYVNIVDLVDACKTPDAKPRIFSSEQDLAKYIQRTGKVFPLSKARDNPLLSTFLIHVNANGRGGGGRGSAGRRRRRKAKAKAKADAEAKVAEEAKEKGTVEAKASATKADGKDKVCPPLSLQIRTRIVSDYLVCHTSRASDAYGGTLRYPSRPAIRVPRIALCYVGAQTPVKLDFWFDRCIPLSIRFKQLLIIAQLGYKALTGIVTGLRGRVPPQSSGSKLQGSNCMQ